MTISEEGTNRQETSIISQRHMWCHGREVGRVLTLADATKEVLIDVVDGRAGESINSVALFEL